MPIGPTLPPHLAAAAQGGESESDDDDFGPALPPHLAAARAPAAADSARPAAGPASPQAGPSRPVAGPSRPPPAVAARYQDDDDSDDDVVGPMPVPEGQEDDNSAVRQFMEREARWAQEREEAEKPKALKRDEWMLVPPDLKDLQASLDPLKPRPKTFSKSTTAAPVTDAERTLWTETPKERQQRLQDEMMGKKRKAEVSAAGADEEEEAENEIKRRRENEIRRGINGYNAKNRQDSLLDSHTRAQNAKPKNPDDAPPAIWDRDRDMGVTGALLSDQDRAKKIKDARGLGDRFGHGKSGAFIG